VTNKDLYDQWLRKRQPMQVPDGFTHRVMATIHKENQRSRSPWWESWVAVSLVQIGLAAAAAVVCVLRFAVLFTAAVGGM